MKLTRLSTIRNLILAGVFLFQLVVPQMQVKAEAVLTIEPITWNVIGLDSNNVNVGPNNFPVGARICNTGDEVTGGLIATLVWDSPNDYVDIRPGSLNPITLSTLAAGTPSSPSCYDFYFEVSVVRNANAYDTTRRYHIEVSSAAGTPEFSTISTPNPRELYVEHLISQNRNSTDNVSYAPGANVDAGSLVSVAPGGTLSLMVGNIYTIRLDASTATQGYNQLEDFINFPNTVFQILSVKSTYTANSSGYVANSSDKLYADACLWDMDPTSETYLSCIGSDGKVGGTISTTYNVKIIGGAGTSASLNTLIYDFSGSSFHYNSDFSSSSRIVTISSGIALEKSFSPQSIIPGGSSTLTLNITNTSSTDITGISLSDNLPDSPAQMTVTSPAGVVATDTDCLTPVFAPVSGNTSLTFSGGVKANSTCTVSVNVTASTLGTYVNTTEEMLVNDIGTGITASANLMVEDTPSASCTDVTIAEWTNFATSTGVVPIATTNNTGGNAIALYTGTQQSTDGTWWLMKDAATTSVSIADGNPYFGFQITTTGMSNVKMSFNYTKGSNQAAEFLDIYYSNTNVVNPAPPKFDGVTLPLDLTGTNDPAFLTATDLDFSGKTNLTGDTYFYIFPYGAQNSGGVWTGINNITFSACLPLYSIQKSFSPDPIPAGDTSVLTFQLRNADSNPAGSAAFSDTLPAGMTITSPAASTTCGGSLTAAEGTSEISLSGGTIPAKPVDQDYGVCTVTVNVITADAGAYPNTSGYLSVGGTALNSKASDTLTVLDPPVLTKAFSPNPIYAGNTSTLTFTIQNPNTDQGLTGVSFSDTFPANLTLAAAPSSPQCGGTVTSDSGSITLTDGILAAGETCTVTASVTSTLVGEYLNTSGAVTATETGAGNTASDTLVVQAVHPGISVLKEVATNSNGPWANRVSVEPGGDVYYRITVENIGDVPLTTINVSDVSSPENTNVDNAVVACSWPAVLPVGSSTTDPSATCVIGPFTAVTGTNDNTATAHGTYNGTVYDSDPDTATYATTSLSLAKNVTEPSFTTAGDTLNFTYTITNLSDAELSGIFSLFDTNLSSFTCLLDGNPVSTGANVTLAANNVGNDDTIVCTGVYSVTAFDVSVGSVTNTAYATIGSTRSNSDRVTVFANEPDLIVSKTNDTNNNASTGTVFAWDIRVSNQGPADAVFSSGDTILSDALPAGASYSVSQPSEIANILCAVDGGNVLTCTANGTSVTIPGTSGYFTVGVDATPSITGSLSNSQAIADPLDVIAESNEGNNIAGNAVNVTSTLDLVISKDDSVSSLSANDPVSYSIVVTNNGPSAADGAVFSDPSVSNLTVTGVTCGTALNGAACPVVENTTVPLMQGVGIVIPTLPATGSVTFTVSGTAGTSGSIVNNAYITPPSGTADSNMNNNAATDTDTIGSPSADLSISKDDSVTEVTAGDTVDYTVIVTNSGPSAADGAVLTDPSVSNLTVTGVTCDSTTGSAVCPDLADTTVTLLQGTGIIIPTLPSGGTVTFTISGTAGASGSIANTASVAAPSGTTDPDTGNNSATDTDTINPSADLSISKNDSVTEVAAGDTVDYTVIVTNSGPSAADGAVLTDPSVTNLTVTGVTCDSTTGSAVCPDPADTTVTLLQGTGIIIPTLPSGGTVTFTISGTAGASGSIANTASVAVPSGTTDPDTGNNSAADTDTINPSADLSISKDDSVTEVTAGSAVSYTVIVTNSGPSAADGAVLTDPSATNLTVTGVTCDSTTGSAVCPDLADTTVTLLQGTGIIIPTLPSGGTVTFTISGTAGASGSIANTASVAAPSGTTDPDTGNNSATDTDTINPSADLSISKNDSVTEVAAGDTVDYTVIVTNSGPSAADGAVLTDPSVTNLTVTGVTCDSTTGSAVCPDPADTTVTLLQGTGIIIPTLPSGGTATFTISGTAGVSGSITNTASVAVPSGTTDPDTDNNSAADTDTINPSADLSVSKDDSVTSVAPGAAVSYTVIVTNSGPSAADGAVLTDPSVSNLTVTGVTCDSTTGSAVCPDPGNTTVTLLQGTGIVIPTLPSGGTVTFTISGTAGASGSIANTASVAVPSGVTDPDSGNNSDTDTDNISSTAELTVTKNSTTVSITSAGQVVPYTYVVTNTGSLTLTNVSLTDNNTDAVPVCSPAQPATLAPGAHLDCTAQHTVTLAEMNTGGNVSNTATADSDESDPDSASLDIPVSQNPSLTVTKSSTTSEITTTGAVPYTYVVTNNGNVTLTNVTLTDNHTDATPVCSPSQPATLAPGAHLDCTAQYTVTQADLNTGGNVSNTATADSNESSSAQDNLDIPISQGPELTVVKTSSTTAITAVDQVVPYTYVVTNSGNITLNNVSLADDNTDATPVCSPAQPAVLAPGDHLDCTAQHTVTLAEMETGGNVSNTATADSTESDPAEDTLDIPVHQISIGVAKRAVSVTEVSAGTYAVTYDILVKNYSNVELSNIQVTDDLDSTFPSPLTYTIHSLSSSDFTVNTPDYDGSTDTNLLDGSDTLAAGASGTIRLVVHVVPTTVGPFENTAFASGESPTGVSTNDESSDGTDPDNTADCSSCVNNNGDPTDNTKSTDITFGPNLFDPPSGVKTYDDSGLPILRWTMVWINDSNILAIDAQVNDPIPAGTVFVASGAPSGYPVPGGAPADSTNLGVSCVPDAASTLTTTTLCYYEGPTPTYERGRIIWEGSIGPDLGATNAANAANEISISFNVDVEAGVTSVSNTATVDADLNGDGLINSADGETSVGVASAVRGLPETEELPKTGFAPDVLTELPIQPEELAYSTYGDVWLEIPALDVQTGIVGVPYQLGEWNVSWLGEQTGWLQGTAFPSFSGNSVLTAHVYLPNGQPGPFIHLGDLKPNAEVLVHAFGLVYVYQVQSNMISLPSDLSALQHEEEPWLTLLTCMGYDDKADLYHYRIKVRAVLVDVRTEPLRRTDK